MERIPLLRSQRNALYLAIQQNGLDPAEFEFHETRSEPIDLDVPLLLHKPTGFFFTFDYQDSWDGISRMSESRPGLDEVTGRRSFASWAQQYEAVEEWIRSVRAEWIEPDLWIAGQQAGSLHDASSPDASNVPFTADERERLASGIQEIERFLTTTQHLADDRHAYLVSQLQYLTDAGNRMGRKDWANVALGVLSNIAIGLALDPDAARERFRLAGNVLGRVLGHGPLLP